MALKFLYKLFIEQEVKWADGFRAFCVFPIDMAFLSLSFFAAFIYSAPIEKLNLTSSKDMLALFVFLLVITVIVTVLCKKSDRAVVASRYWLTGTLTVLSYGLSFILMFGILNVGASLR